MSRPFKVRNPEDKVIVAERTAAVKSAFERELGLKVDRRRDGGFGNTNTGNVARKAFASAHLPLANPSTQKNLENRVKKPLSST